MNKAKFLAREYKINNIPTFIINDNYKIEGAQDYKDIRDFILKTKKKRFKKPLFAYNFICIYNPKYRCPNFDTYLSDRWVSSILFQKLCLGECHTLGLIS